MADMYEILLGGAPTEQQQMQAMADRLRRREAMGTLGMLSGDPVLGPYGQGELGRVREDVGRLRKARQAATQIRPSGNPRYYMRGNELVMMPGQLEYEEMQRTHALEKARIAAEGMAARQAATAARKRQYIPESSWGGKSGIAAGLSQIDALASLVKPISEAEDIAQPTADVMQGWLTDVGLGGVTRLTEPMYKSLDSRQLRSSLENAITALRNSMFGAALTKYEAGRFESVSPLAPGLKKEEMVKRTQNLVDYLTSQAQYKTQGRLSPAGQEMPEFVTQGFSWEEMTGPEGTAVAAETPEGTVQAAQPAGASGLINVNNPITFQDSTGQTVTVYPDGRIEKQ